ncbi:MAG: hypothetical protein E7546_05120 [Ruminococcaceae bacterium]|nr:hypothetical protein [Oscillospiraceae bacterium]
MITCPYCDNLVANGETHCAICGKELNVDPTPPRPFFRPTSSRQGATRLNFEMTSTPERNYGINYAKALKVISIIISVLVALCGIGIGIYMLTLTDNPEMVWTAVAIMAAGALLSVILLFVFMVGVKTFENLLYCAYNTEKAYMISENQSRMMVQAVSDLKSQTESLTQAVPVLQSILADQKDRGRFIEQQSTLMQQLIARQDDGNLSIQQATAAVKALAADREANGDKIVIPENEKHTELLAAIAEKLDRLAETPSREEAPVQYDFSPILEKLDMLNETLAGINEPVLAQIDEVKATVIDCSGDVMTAVEQASQEAEAVETAEELDNSDEKTYDVDDIVSDDDSDDDDDSCEIAQPTEEDTEVPDDIMQEAQDAPVDDTQEEEETPVPVDEQDEIVSVTQDVISSVPDTPSDAPEIPSEEIKVAEKLFIGLEDVVGAGHDIDQFFN